MRQPIRIWRRPSRWSRSLPLCTGAAFLVWGLVLGSPSGPAGASPAADPAPHRYGAIPMPAVKLGVVGKIVIDQISGGPGLPSTATAVDPDGSTAQQIGPPGDTICPAWSPDSTKLVCNVWHEPDSGLFPPQPAIANADGSGFKVLDPTASDGFFCHRWSPDGTRLLCDGPGGFYTADATDLGDRKLVTGWLPDGLGAANAYGWSPDGSRILIAALDASDTGTVFSMKPDGSDPIRLNPVGTSVISQDFFQESGADWSPDGSQVVMALRLLGPGGQVVDRALYVVNADGTGLHQVTPGSLFAVTAQWSPDGQWLAFTSRPPSGPGGRKVWLIRPNGTGLRQVTPVGPATQYEAPVWSPDSQQLVFNRVAADGATSVWVANRNGSGLHHVIDTAGLMAYDWGSAPTG